ncbi:thiamine-phosphate kinase [Aquimonas voraii]|uniref:Thiamine-monophosphate kinase n=1 Tax=Aquimonas voraii TaxID=265719 RepID=A0A1G6W4E9_9GAMM|nr:thiamine-phosphate kinase [Aquimonas voraii]SDD60711.1 thiamine-phosphate kinase [Aquimonas voraii]
MATGEFDLIARIAARSRIRPDVLLGIGDDAALLASPPAGEALCVCVDTLNAGVHFPLETAPFDIGWKALAVNLSDLAAMGATPRWATLALSLASPAPAFVDALIDGLLSLAEQHDVALVGGDTTRGPLSLSVQAIGSVAPAQALRRDAARAGDALYVSGSLGDAAAGLALLQGRIACGHTAVAETLRARLDRPTPRLALGCALAGVARAGIDVSDGLLADLGHVLQASGVGAVIDLDALPASTALCALLPEAEQRWPLQLAGGDDYELVVSGDAERIEALPEFARGELARIGRITAEPGLAFERGGRACGYVPSGRGYEHFV